jgi:hypothetical protein
MENVVLALIPRMSTETINKTVRKNH